MSGRRLLVLAAFAALATLLALTLTYRVEAADQGALASFIPWNLSLAWLGLLPIVACGARRALPALVAALVALLLIPNEPYLVTDIFVHWSFGPPVHRLEHLTVLFSAAAAGLLLYAIALARLRALFRRLGARPRLENLLSGAIICSTSLAVDLGRTDPRLNSWDIVTRPRLLIIHLEATLTSPWTVVLLLLASAALALWLCLIRALCRVPL